MAPGRRKGSSGRAAAAAAAKAQQFKVGDLVLAKMKGFPAWPAAISDPSDWDLAPVKKKVLVYFYGTRQIAFCNYADIEAFTEEKKKSLLLKRQGKGADFVRALDEIIHMYDTLEKQKVKEPGLDAEDTKAEVKIEECHRSISLKKGPEDSCLAAGNDSKADLALDNHDKNHYISPTLIGDDILKNELLNSETIEEVSILDRLRKNPLSTGTASRKKRLRGAPQNNSLSRKRTPRTQSSSDSPKNGESNSLDDFNLSATNLIHDPTQEDPLHRNSTSTLDLNDVVGQHSIKLPANISSDDVETEQVIKSYESSSMDEKEMVESSQMVEVSVNGCLNSDVPLNEKLELLTTTVICKKKRKSNRKRLNAIECSSQDKEHDSQVDNCSSHFESLIRRDERAEKLIKPDGDEHLPLVKRARVRMEKTGEESQLNVLSSSMEKSEMQERLINSDHNCASDSARNQYPPTEGSFKDRNPSPVNISLPSAKSNVLFWRTKKYQISGFEMDAEAALPPSKRLHRALEAMSANVADAKDDCSESPVAPQSNGCLDSQTISSLHICPGGTVQSPTILNNTIGSNKLKTSPCKFSSVNVDAAALSSEVKCNSALNGDCSGMRIDCNGAMEDATKVSGRFMSCTISDVQNKVLKPCSSSNEVDATSYEGANDQLCSPLGKVNECRILEEERHDSPVNNVLGNGTTKFVMNKRECILKAECLGHPFPFDGCYTESTAVAVASAINTSEVTNFDRLHTDGELESREMQDVAIECKPRLTPYETHNSPDLTPMKELIAAAQARRLLSRSISFADSNVDTRVVADSLASPVVLREDSSNRVSPPKCTISHPFSTDDRAHSHSKYGSNSHSSLQLKGLNRLNIDAESYAVKRSFETFICTLTRTKESIGRATRLAIDCAKHGIAREVIDILLQNLEREPSLHRRIDLFFLVDSITQCSRSLKGAGDVYPSLVQSVLPRLLSAAAPRGNAAFENRRQCLKVLRLWVERRILPEAMIRHHIRELDSLDEVLLASSSRRPSRTERAYDDPVREMEGMLVDEYGSNAGFQLSCLNLNVLDDEEGSASDERTFEAVTPEMHAEISHENGTIEVNTEKHRHVLEAVDGELEMEDVAPPCGTEVMAPRAAGGEDSSCSHKTSDQFPSSFVPPLPEDSPPPPPPLPSSPPPSFPACTATDGVVPQQNVGPLPYGEPDDVHFSSTKNIIQMPLSQPLNRHPVPNAGVMSSESRPYYASGYDGLCKPMPPPISSNISSGYSNFSVPQPPLHSQNSCLPLASAPMTNKAYSVQPPLPRISNHFSYIQAETQQKTQTWGNRTSFPERFQYVHDGCRGNNYGDQCSRGRYHHDLTERDNFSPLLRPGPSHCDKVDMPPPVCHYGRPSDPPRIPSNGWLHCPRASNYPLSTTRPSVDGPTAPMAGAPGYWRPR